MTTNERQDITCSADFGFQISTPVNDRTGKIIAASGAFERGTSRLIYSLLQCGDHFVDLGANVGYFTLLAAARIGPLGKVTSFEPARSVRSTLEHNITMNGFRQVTVIPVAASDRNGTSSFFEGPPDHTGISSLRSLPEASSGYTVETTTLDEVLPDNAVRVIKIDIEGGETAAIKGMTNTLQRNRPAIILESTDRFLRELNSSADELFQTLFSQGYQAWTFGDDWLRPIPECFPAPIHQCNVLFTHEDRRDLNILKQAGYRIERGTLVNAAEFGRTLRILYFPMHGDAAIELCELSRSAGVRIDIAGIDNGFVAAKTPESEREQLTFIGAGAPTKAEISERLRKRMYDAVVLGKVSQIREFEKTVRAIDPRIPFVVRHSNNIFEELKALPVSHFMSPSPGALNRMNHCHTLRTRKLIRWDEFPPANLNPAHRNGYSAFVHEYRKSWPDAWQRLQEVNRHLRSAQVVPFGVGNPPGPIPDLLQMNRSRATVQLKDSGICCFSVVRSLAMATPVVCDRLTYNRTFLDSIEGLIVCEDGAEVVAQLERLSNDDPYWEKCARHALSCARRQFLPDYDLASQFLKFLQSVADSKDRKEKQGSAHCAP